MPRNAAGITRRFSAVSGHVQYEICFDFGTTPAKAKAGATFGAAFYVNDTGNHYFDHYGNTGEWPYGYLWEALEPLPPMPQGISVSMEPSVATIYHRDDDRCRRQYPCFFCSILLA